MGSSAVSSRSHSQSHFRHGRARTFSFPPTVSFWVLYSLAISRRALRKRQPTPEFSPASLVASPQPCVGSWVAGWTPRWAYTGLVEPTRRDRPSHSGYPCTRYVFDAGWGHWWVRRRVALEESPLTSDTWCRELTSQHSCPEYRGCIPPPDSYPTWRVLDGARSMSPCWRCSSVQDGYRRSPRHSRIRRCRFSTNRSSF